MQLDSNKSRRRRRKGDPDQLILPLSGNTPPEVLALRSIAYEVTGMKRHEWRQCKEVAIAIVFCGLRDGCRAHVRQLIRVANENAPDGEPVIGSQATAYRALDRLSQLGLLIEEPQSSSKGKAPTLRRLAADVLRKLLEDSRKWAHENREIPENGEFLEKTLRKPCENPEKIRPYIETSLTSETYSTQPRSTVDVDPKSNWPGEEIERVRRVARFIAPKLGPRMILEDRDLLCKAVHLAGRVFSEHWLHDAVEAVRNKRPPAQRPWAYFHQCLSEGAERQGKNLNRELSRVTVPAELLKRRRDPVDDLTLRLCVAPEDRR